MLTNISIIEQAVNRKTSRSELPKSSAVVNSLLGLEKQSKKEKLDCSFANLIGCWNLIFITGTKKTRQKAGTVLGAGQYIPRLIKIQITYENDQQLLPNTGRVINSVELAFLKLSLTGPVKFIPQKRILAFDFTCLKLNLLGFRIYDGYIRNGLEKEAEFYQTEIKHQAFFSYFLIEDNFIAARGRGGGLALWSRQVSEKYLLQSQD